MSNPPDPIDLEAIRIKLEALKSEHRVRASQKLRQRCQPVQHSSLQDDHT